MKEIFKQFRETRKYTWFIGDQGNVKRVDKNGEEEIYKGFYNDGTGYYQVPLNGGSTSVHRLVATYFVEKRPGMDVVDHINSDRKDNRACNLRWTTRKENNSTEHARKMKRLNYNAGERRPIRLRKDGFEISFPTPAEAARFINCTKQNIYHVLNKNKYSRTARGWKVEYI